MFVVLGSPRSGTTLLKECLNLSNQAYIPDQTGILGPIAHLYNNVADMRIAGRLAGEFIIASNSFAETFGLYLSADEVREIFESAQAGFTEAADSLYTALARKAGRSAGGDKTPDDLLSIRSLEQAGFLASQVKFVHLIRDVRGVVASLLKVSWSPPDIEEIMPRLWSTSNLHAYRSLVGRDNYLLLRYEDFVTAPEKHLRDICNFLEIGYCEAMMQHELRGVRFRVQSSHTNLGHPFLPDRAQAWKAELSAEVMRHCTKSAAEALEAFQYDLS